jgi:hypothetical protein
LVERRDRARSIHCPDRSASAASFRIRHPSDPRPALDPQYSIQSPGSSIRKGPAPLERRRDRGRLSLVLDGTRIGADRESWSQCAGF